LRGEGSTWQKVVGRLVCLTLTLIVISNLHPASPALSQQEKTIRSSELTGSAKDPRGSAGKDQTAPKDNWDKLKIVAPIFSGLLTFLSALIVALIGFYATNVYNRRQIEKEQAQRDRELKNLEVQTVAQFMSYLSSNNELEKQGAIEAIASLGNPELATKIGRIFGGSGAHAALSKLATLPDPEIAQNAEAALSELFGSRKASIVNIMTPEGQGRATGFFITSTGSILTAAHVVAHSELEGWHVQMANGTIAPATILGIDEDNAVAILQAEIDEHVIPLQLTQAPVELGAEVIALGYDAGTVLNASVGTVTEVSFDTNLGTGRIGVAMKSMPEFSGAPVLDAQGRLVGMVQGYAPGLELTVLIPATAVVSASEKLDI
jgi:S1-C subfamily serine protease